MTDEELEQISCTEEEISEWKALAKRRKWKWGDDKFIKMMKHMKYLKDVLEYYDPSCESPPELIAYDAAKRFGVDPHTIYITLLSSRPVLLFK